MKKVYLIFALLLVSGAGLHAQSQTSPFRELTSALNLSVADTVSGLNLDLNIIYPTAKHGDVALNVIAPGGAGNPWVYQVLYTPDPGFVGVDTFALEYNYIGNYPYLTYRAYRVAVFPSIVKPQPDYAVASSASNITLDVLSNDIATNGPLTLSAVSTVDHGFASIVSNQIAFTPDPGYEGTAHINYTVCDASNHCTNAYASVGVNDNPSPVNDSLQVYVAKNASLSVPLLYGGYTVQQAPAHGTVFCSGQHFRYTPVFNYTGVDQFVLVYTSGSTTVYKTVKVGVFNAQTPNTMAMEDNKFTPKNQAITFNVRSNDIGNLYVKSWVIPANLPGTVSNTNSSGNVTFTPNQNYSGVATFYYKIGNTNIPDLEIGTVNVYVGDLAPAAPIYELTTPKSTAAVINYQIPFSGFNFTVTDSPDHGTCTVYPGWTTQNIGGQSVSGNNLVVYSPTANYIGLDEFELKYCVNANGNCQTVKISMTVTEVYGSNAPYCVGQNCVWTGDINNDGIVNNKDLLPLGYMMGMQGTTRSNASLEWYGQYSTNWNNPFTGISTDVKFADTDGSGEVDALDTTALNLFYGQTHQIQPKIPSAGKGLPFFLKRLTPPNPGVGDLVRFEVSLGDSANQVTNLYGFTFDVSLSPQIVDSAFQFDWYSDSWLNLNAPYLTMAKRPRTGRFETAFTRTNGISASGIGAIGAFDFVIIDVIQGGRPAGEGGTMITIDNPVFWFGDGQSIEAPSFSFPLEVQTTSSAVAQPEFSDAQLIVYPNPANDQLQIHLNGSDLIESVQVLDLSGRTLYQSGSLQAEHTQVNTAELLNGMYLVKVRTQHGIVARKFQVQR